MVISKNNYLQLNNHALTYFKALIRSYVSAWKQFFGVVKTGEGFIVGKIAISLWIKTMKKVCKKISKNKIIDNKIIVEFDKEDCFRICQAFLSIIYDELVRMERRHSKILDIFKQDLQVVNNEIIIDNAKQKQGKLITIELGSEDFFDTLFEQLKIIANERELTQIRHMGMFEKLLLFSPIS